MAFADLESIYHGIAQWVDQSMVDFVDVCDMLSAKFATETARNALSENLKGMYEECVQAVPGADVFKDEYIKVIPTTDSESAVVHGHVMLWQLGFSGAAALKGATPSEKGRAFVR